jgi:hypothetical protein
VVPVELTGDSVLSKCVCTIGMMGAIRVACILNKVVHQLF